MQRHRRLMTMLIVFVMLFGTLPVSAATKYGKVGGRTYYYTISKTKNRRIEKKGEKAGSHLKKWMAGNLRLVAEYALGDYAIPFNVVENMVNNDSVKYYEKSYSSYVFQTKYKQRKIFYYSDKARKRRNVVLQDEKGVADVFYEFHPVGVGFKKSTYSKKIRSKATVKTMFYDSKKRNLQRCHINANHRSREIWTLNAEILSERWKR